MQAFLAAKIIYDVWHNCLFLPSISQSRVGLEEREGRIPHWVSALMRAGICLSLPQVPSVPQDIIHQAKWIFMGKCCGRKFEQFWIIPLISRAFPNSRILMAF